jgi:hypothetical protein
MPGWATMTAAVLGGGAATLAAALALGARSWARDTARTLERLHAAPREKDVATETRERAPQPLASVAVRDHVSVAPPPAAARYDPAELEGLPAPVARYFSFALAPGQPLVLRARFTQQGTFATARERWAPFTATEDFTVFPPGFVWDARIRMAPFVSVRVRDSYLAGQGIMHGELGGLVTVVDQRDTPEMAAGALLRYLAEAAWLPTALLPASGVTWEGLDESSARATLRDAGVTVSMEVRFGASGEIASISAMRHRDVKGKPVLTPWSGRFSSYARVHGMMVPTESEVGWDLPDGRYTYWRGRTTSAELSFLGAGE